jgi:hypothetical protein
LITLKSLKFQKINKSILFEIIGWIGVLCIILSYALASLGTITSNNICYYAIVITGASCAGIFTYYKKIYQSVIINLIVVGFSIWGLIRIIYFHH